MIEAEPWKDKWLCAENSLKRSESEDWTSSENVRLVAAITKCNPVNPNWEHVSELMKNQPEAKQRVSDFFSPKNCSNQFQHIHHKYRYLSHNNFIGDTTPVSGAFFLADHLISILATEALLEKSQLLGKNSAGVSQSGRVTNSQIQNLPSERIWGSPISSTLDIIPDTIFEDAVQYESPAESLSEDYFRFSMMENSTNPNPVLTGPAAIARKSHPKKSNAPERSPAVPQEMRHFGGLTKPSCTTSSANEIKGDDNRKTRKSPPIRKSPRASTSNIHFEKPATAYMRILPSSSPAIARKRKTTGISEISQKLAITAAAASVSASSTNSKLNTEMLESFKQKADEDRNKVVKKREKSEKVSLSFMLEVNGEVKLTTLSQLQEQKKAIRELRGSAQVYESKVSTKPIDISTEKATTPSTSIVIPSTVLYNNLTTEYSKIVPSFKRPSCLKQAFKNKIFKPVVIKSQGSEAEIHPTPSVTSSLPESVPHQVQAIQINPTNKTIEPLTDKSNAETLTSVKVSLDQLTNENAPSKMRPEKSLPSVQSQCNSETNANIEKSQILENKLDTNETDRKLDEAISRSTKILSCALSINENSKLRLSDESEVINGVSTSENYSEPIKNIDSVPSTRVLRSSKKQKLLVSDFSHQQKNPKVAPFKIYMNEDDSIFKSRNIKNQDKPVGLQVSEAEDGGSTFKPSDNDHDVTSEPCSPIKTTTQETKLRDCTCPAHASHQIHVSPNCPIHKSSIHQLQEPKLSTFMSSRSSNASGILSSNNVPQEELMFLFRQVLGFTPEEFYFSAFTGFPEGNNKVIKMPMDLLTIMEMLKAGQITTLAGLEKNLLLTFTHAIFAHPANHPVAKKAHCAALSLRKLLMEYASSEILHQRFTQFQETGGLVVLTPEVDNHLNQEVNQIRRPLSPDITELPIRRRIIRKAKRMKLKK